MRKFIYALFAFAFPLVFQTSAFAADPTISFKAANDGRISGRVDLAKTCKGGSLAIKANVSIDQDPQDGNPGISKQSFFLKTVKLRKNKRVYYRTLKLLPPIATVGGTAPTVTLQARVICKGVKSYTAAKAHRISCGEGTALSFPKWIASFVGTFSAS